MLWCGFRVIQVVLLSMTLTFLLVRLRQPRPSILSLPRQPGTAAGLAIVFGLFWVTGWMHRLFFGKFHDATLTAVSVGGSVALAWALLALGRLWEAEPGWVDRFGRLIGSVAIVNALLVIAAFGI